MTLKDQDFDNLKEFDGHKLISYFSDQETGLKAIVAIHRGGLKNPSFGATRIWNYASEHEAAKDAIKLSRIMSYKSALAGLKYGGAKGVIISSNLSKTRKKALIKSYSKHLNYLDGHFITGADVGINPEDVRLMRLNCPYIVGIGVDPVRFTSLGVYFSLQVCLKEVFNSDNLTNRTFAIQGVGKTGTGLLRKIYHQAKKIYISDVNKNRVNLIKKQFPKVEFIPPSEIYKQEVDVYSPCALSNAINSKNLATFKCKIIMGSANSQLENAQIGEKLFKLGILYAPDYVVNAGGLIAVVDEYEHKNYSEERIQKRVQNIKNTLKTIIDKSKATKKSTNIVADEMAEKLFKKFV